MSTPDSMITVDELVADIVFRNLAHGRRDDEAAQNGVNRLAARLGAIGHQFDVRYRCGSDTSRYLEDLAGDLAVEAVVMLVNVVGAKRVAEVLGRRVKITKR